MKMRIVVKKSLAVHGAMLLLGLSREVCGSHLNAPVLKELLDVSPDGGFPTGPSGDSMGDGAFVAAHKRNPALPSSSGTPENRNALYMEGGGINQPSTSKNAVVHDQEAQRLGLLANTFLYTCPPATSDSVSRKRSASGNVVGRNPLPQNSAPSHPPERKDPAHMPASHACVPPYTSADYQKPNALYGNMHSTANNAGTSQQRLVANMEHARTYTVAGASGHQNKYAPAHASAPANNIVPFRDACFRHICTMSKSGAYMEIHPSAYLSDQSLARQGHPASMEISKVFTCCLEPSTISQVRLNALRCVVSSKPGCSIWCFFLKYFSLAQCGCAERDVQIMGKRDFFFSGHMKGHRGYYPNLLNDIHAYIEENSPDEYVSIMDPKRVTQRVKKNALGNLYGYPPIMTENTSRVINRIGCNLARLNGFMFCMRIPEVLDDFLRMDSETFELSLHYMCICCAERYRESPKLKRAVEILRALYSAVRNWKLEPEKAFPHVESEIEPKELWGSAEASSIEDIEPAYREAYNAISLFYKFSLWTYYSDASNGAIKTQRRFLGKRAVSRAPYLKSKIVILDEGKRHFHVVQEESKIVYNRWEACTPELHIHVHFVDNYAQKYRLVCMPGRILQNKWTPLHSISKVCEYLHLMHNTLAGNVYPLSYNTSTKKWGLVSGSDLQMTVNDLDEQGRAVVFYYLRETIDSGQFTFSVFDSSDDVQGRIKIPLFLSPLMRSALLLTPYAHKGLVPHQIVPLRDFVDGNVEPSVYFYPGDPPEGNCAQTDEQAYTYTHIRGMYNNLYMYSPAASPRCWEMCVSQTEDPTTRAITVCWYAIVRENKETYSQFIFRQADGSTPAEQHKSIADQIENIKRYYALKCENVCMSIVCVSKNKAKEGAGVLAASECQDCLYIPGQCLLLIRGVRKFNHELRIHNLLLSLFFRKHKI
ncbi:uncharacterized protein NEMAJ01_1954 [Nematocida major]|uniref:uncharacterized protein n=1 Tax=Nematocida major TaxID=1912982 RepID=UPI0020080BCA|nr:uncharacterized protein NEMAJ01_1954 [Nematocida major]KAH9387058.1 hypothetical protein NEMAJ01_1954 [Nematocida major]